MATPASVRTAQPVPIPAPHPGPLLSTHWCPVLLLEAAFLEPGCCGIVPGGSEKPPVLDP